MKLRLVMAGIATSLAFGAAQATDLSKARYLAAACANCHGTNGNAVDGGFSLAGYPKDRFIDTMAASSPASVRPPSCTKSPRATPTSRSPPWATSSAAQKKR